MIQYKKIKLFPIVDSVRKEEISDDIYFSKEYSHYISNSRLKLLNSEEGGSPQMYKEGFKSQFCSSLTLGTAVHELVLQGEEFTLSKAIDKPTAKLGAVIDQIIINRRLGKSIYGSIHDACIKVNYYVNNIDSKIEYIIKSGLKYYLQAKDLSKNTITLSNNDVVTVENMLEKIKHNRAVQRLLHPINEFGEEFDSFNEDAMFISFVGVYNEKATILPIKIKIDNWSIDVDNKILTLNDLKTTAEFSLTQFMNGSPESHWNKYHYYRQMAFYKMVLEEYCKIRYGFDETWETRINMIVSQTVGNNQCSVYTVNKKELSRGEKEYTRLLKELTYYQIVGFNNQETFE